MDVYKQGCTESGIPLSHLDYNYVEKCTDVKELEKIVKVLRSGKEGCYPALETSAEARLAELNPNSKVLRKDKPVSTYADLDSQEQKELSEDLLNWTNAMKNKEQNVEANGPNLSEENLPPVRGVGKQIPLDKNATGEETKLKKNKRVKPRDYKEWDKFDIDAELAKADKVPETKTTPAQCSKQSISDTLDGKGLSEEEKYNRSVREKDKGNEAFRAGDLEEALIYYSRSISIYPNIDSLNNRAQAYIKLKKWAKAIEDCNAILKTDPANIKALYRRGVSSKGHGNLTQARADIQSVLVIEPNNKQAQDFSKELREPPKKRNRKGRRMVIQEVEGNENEAEQNKRESPKQKDKPVDKTEQKVPSEKLAENVSKEENKDIWTAADVTCGNEQAKQISSENKNTTKSKKSNKKAKKVTTDNKTASKDIVSEKPDVENKSTLKSTESSDKINDNQKSTVAEASSDTLSSNVQTAGIKEKENSTESRTSPVEVATSQEQTEENNKEQSSPPPVPPAPLPDAVAVLKEEGNNCFKTGQYPEAIDCYTTCITMLEAAEGNHDINLSVLYNNRAMSRTKIGDCRGCITDCNSALEHSPGAFKPLIRRAMAYESLEKYREAYIDYRQVLLLDSSCDVAQAAASRCSQILQQQDGVRWRDKLPTGNNTGAPQHKTKASNKPGAVQPEVKSEASPRAVPPEVKSETSPVKISSGTKRAYEKLKEKGNALVKKGDYSDAIKCYTDCIVLCPNIAVAYSNRALCFLKNNAPDKVLEDCTTALKLEPDNLKALFRRAMAYKMLDKYLESKSDFQAVLDIEPHNPMARKELDIVSKFQDGLEAMKKLDDLRKAKKKERQKVEIQEVEESSDDEYFLAKENKDELVQQSPKKQKKVKNLNKQSDTCHSKKQQDKQLDHDGQPLKSDTKHRTSGQTKTNKSKQVNVKDSQQSQEKMKRTQKSNTSNKTGNNTMSDGVDGGKSSGTSPYEFMQHWTAIKSSRDTEAYADLLSQVEPTDLRKVISNKLDGPMLNTIVDCLQLFISQGNCQKALSYLSQLTKVSRFEMVTMFMSSQDKQALEGVFQDLAGDSQVSSNDLRDVRAKFNL